MHKYEDTKNIIHKLACSIANTREYEISDLIFAGNEAWITAEREWKPECDTKFSSFLYSVCKNAMLSHIRKFKQPIAWEPAFMEVPAPPTEERTYIFWEWVGGLKEDTQYVVRLALSNPIEKLGLVPQTINKPRKLLSAIKQHLRDIGWSQWRIITTLADLKQEMT